MAIPVAHAGKFICGITGVVRDEHRHVLLLRHRLWPPDRQWASPPATPARANVMRTSSPRGSRGNRAHRQNRVATESPQRFLYRIEVYYEAVVVGGLDGLKLDPKEVLEARLFSPAALPDGMSETHRELAASLALQRSGPV